MHGGTDHNKRSSPLILHHFEGNTSKKVTDSRVSQKPVLAPTHCETVPSTLAVSAWSIISRIDPYLGQVSESREGVGPNAHGHLIQKTPVHPFAYRAFPCVCPGASVGTIGWLGESYTWSN